MDRRAVLGGLASVAIGGAAHARARGGMPVPKWRPTFGQPLADVIDRLRYYTDQKRDFVVYRNGTCVLVDDGLDDPVAKAAAQAKLDAVYHAHPDVNPLRMDDGNMLLQFSERDVSMVVLTAVAKAHWNEIDKRHKDGLVPDEVLITPLGQNVFDERGKMVLFGRALMFLDAQAPEIVRIERGSA